MSSQCSCAGLLNTTKIVMSAPLPRVYELGEGGKAVAVPPPPGTAGIIGGDFKGDDLTRSSKETVCSKTLSCNIQMLSNLTYLSASQFG